MLAGGFFHEGGPEQVADERHGEHGADGGVEQHGELEQEDAARVRGLPYARRALDSGWAGLGNPGWLGSFAHGCLRKCYGCDG
jgi:hypothetical protein